MEHANSDKISNTHALQQLTKFQEFYVKFQETSWLPVLHALQYYIISTIVLGFYLAIFSPIGSISLPFLNISQPYATLILVSSFVFFVFIVRAVIIGFIGREKIIKLSLKEYVLLELVLASGLLLLILLVLKMLNLALNTIIEFEIASIYSIIFIVVNLALVRERFKFLHLNISSVKRQTHRNTFVSLRSKYIFYVLTIILLVSIVIFLNNFKFIKYMQTGWGVTIVNSILPNLEIDKFIIFENAIIVLIMFILILVTVFNYGTNLRLKFSILNNTVFQIIMGDYSRDLNSSGNDELGLFTEVIHNVAHEVKEKEKIISIFGKYISPSLAEEITRGKGRLKPGGDKRNVVILRVGILNFDNVFSKLSTKDSVLLINKYYSEIDKILEKRKAILDKISGEICVGIFGLSDIQSGINNAVYAACDIYRYLERVRSKFKVYLEIGIESVTLGLLGTSNKSELTILGKSRRIDSKFQQLATQLKVDVFIDSQCYKYISQELKKLAWKRYNLKVNSGNQIHIFGVKFDGKRSKA